MTSPGEIRADRFLGGRMVLHQPARGYRAGIDPILLAAAVPAKNGQTVLELGCGAGAASLALATRVDGLDLTGVELQAEYCDLAAVNAKENGIDLAVVHADLSDLPAALRQRRFDHVIANPPYFRHDSHSAPNDPGRGLALGEGTPLDSWFDVAARRLAPGGHLHMIQRIDRLPDMLAGCNNRLGSVEVLALAPRQERAPGLAILRARKGGKAPFRLHAPLILHEGAAHVADAESYRPEIKAILRDGAALDWPGSGRA